jgi:cobalamin-dependent methionine synthase I
MGAFCVTTTSFSVDEWAAEFEERFRRWYSIMVKSIGRSFAETLQNICTKKSVIWGYADEITTEAMIERGL